MEKEKKHCCKEDKEKVNCTCEEECHCDDNCTCGENCTCEENCECEECCCEESDCEESTEEYINELESKLKEAEAKVLYEKAEAINYRKRKDEEVSKLLKYCNEDLIQDILPSLDNFERAILLDDNNLEDELSKFLSGFKMIYCHIKDALVKYGVKEIDGANKPFDPTYHNAVLTEKVEGVEPGMILEVLQKGYLLKDKVIRTAMVKVSE